MQHVTKRLEVANSSATLNEDLPDEIETIEEDSCSKSSADDSDCGEVVEESELDDDEEEQEISDFDSLGENDDDCRESEINNVSETAVLTRTTSLCGTDDSSLTMQNWVSHVPHRGIRALSKRADSAQKFGVAVMLGNPDNDHTGWKQCIVPSLFDDGDAVFPVTKSGKSYTNSVRIAERNEVENLQIYSARCAK
ncbi:hypothetical protein HDU84_002147 [Entophlyctis sp. JEL0112]|nr:hypothetical protein HDU84_002147 [Entophlyctis sp. JEL0112]